MRLLRLQNARRIRFHNKFENQNGDGGNDPGVGSWRTDSLSPFSMYGKLQRIYLNIEKRAA